MAAALAVGDALQSAAEDLEVAGVDSSRLDAELLLGAALGIDRAKLLAESKRALEPDEESRFTASMERRKRREPIAYILGNAHFRNLALEVDHRVLIPRPETELLVELADDGQRVLDVGTGSGAIALAVKQEHRDARVTGIDNSPGAIDVARANAQANGLDVEFMIADLAVGGPYDLVVSNPPYVREGEWQGLQPEISMYEPREALLAGPDGLDVIRDLIPAAGEVLRRGGLLGVEVGQGQSRDVEALFERAGLRGVATTRDLAGIPRVVTGRR